MGILYPDKHFNSNKPTFIIKRKRDDGLAVLTPNKRAELEAAGHFSTWRISLSKTPQNDTVTQIEEFPPPEAFEQATTAGQGDAEGTTDQKVRIRTMARCIREGVELHKMLQAHCSGKNCKRALPEGSSGTLCERCRERLKKKQAQAKHRFKLEPRTLIGRTISTGESVHADADVIE